MKKITLLIICFVFVLSSSFAAFIPFYDEYNVNYFTSPALLTETVDDIPFGFELEARSAVDYLSYLASPSSALDKASDYLYNTLMNADLSFWENNYEKIKDIYSSFDKTPFPAKPTAESIEQVRAFLKDSYSSRYSAEHKAKAVLKALDSTDIFTSPDSEKLYSNALLNLSLFGGSAYENGLGWRLSGNIGFIGPENMLLTVKQDQNNGIPASSNLLNIDIRGNVGYALHLINNHFSIGGSLEVAAFMQNYMDSVNLLNARFDANPVGAFSNPFKLGLGFAINFGGMYRHNETLAFTLDLRNAINLRTFWDLELTDFVDYNGIDRDRNVYYMPMDLALTALWDEGPYHLAVEFSDVINQLIWSREMAGYSFDFFSIPKLRFVYDLNESLSLRSSLQYSRLSFGVEYNGFSAEISSALNKLEFGIKMGYSF